MYSLYNILAFVTFVIFINGATAADPRIPYNNDLYNYKGSKAVSHQNSSEVTLKLSDFIPKPTKYWKMVIEFFSDPADDTPAVAVKGFNATELSHQHLTETNSNNVPKHGHNQPWKTIDRNATNWNSTHWNTTHSKSFPDNLLQSLERGTFPRSFPRQYDQQEKYALIFTSYDDYKNSEAYMNADSSFGMRNFAIHNNGNDLLVVHMESRWGDFKFELFPDWTALIANIPTSEHWGGSLRAYTGWEDANGGQYERGVSKVEWQANTGDYTMWINLSLVDGYNLPIQMVWGNLEPSQKSQFEHPLWNHACPVLKCAVDNQTVHEKCPKKNSRWSPGGFQCISDCEVAKRDNDPDEEKICCVKKYDNADPMVCVPSNLYFRDECPNTIIYAHDDRAGTHVCNPGTIVGIEIGGD